MKHRNPLTLIVAWCLLAALPALAKPEPAADNRYTIHAPSRDGIGKFHLGREISQVMGHQGAAWLERSAREVEERPDRVVEGMALAPDAEVLDANPN